MARISLDPPRSLVFRFVESYSRRRYGQVLDPARALAHNPKVLLPYLRFEQKVARWNALDAGLEHLAQMVVAARIGCEWCMDFGYWASQELGMSPEKARAVASWRANRAVFSDLERRVMEYAESMTETPPAVDDALAAGLRHELGERAFVQLTMVSALENLRSRVNTAFGLTGQGFSDRCEVRPLP